MPRCDLLSISVLSIFDTNTFQFYIIIPFVVICFQFQFFLSLIPTRWETRGRAPKLWFAFNFSSFYLWYQLNSFFTFWFVVVICFQFQFFLSLIPTIGLIQVAQNQLWFAFNFSSFYLWYQQDWGGIINRLCCDLLSISVLSIFDTNFETPTIPYGQLWFAFNFSSFYLWYQPLITLITASIVVICFQFQFFLSLIPT